jgi:hypothetical protein
MVDEQAQVSAHVKGLLDELVTTYKELIGLIEISIDL